MDETGHGQIHFVLLSRDRNYSESVDSIHHLSCVPQAAAMDCWLSDCVGSTLDGVPQYACGHADCDSCGNLAKHPEWANVCSPFIYAVTKGISGVVSLVFDQHNPAK